MSSWAHRPDIEGLRAVAILLVVAAHVGIPTLAGGYVGVDVFFVLSGYLITGLLVTEHQATGKISLWNFYARRFRRLLPALAVMLIVTAWLASQIMLPSRLPDIATAGAAASWWLSNASFAFSHTNYFQSGVASNLFLHTWSLGVEEQFYLLWPILLSVVLGSSSLRIAGLRRVLLLVFSISLLACVWMTFQSAIFTFYLTPFRAWQFAGGGLVFIAVLTAKDKNVLARIFGAMVQSRIPLAGSGLAIILVSALMLDEAFRYPGMWAALPTLGAALVLADGANNCQSSFSKILSMRPMQFLGKVSYGWYLWHWPLLILGEELFKESLWNKIAIVLVALLLARLSQGLIEVPVRKSKLLARHSKPTIVASLAVMAGLFWMFVSLVGSSTDESFTRNGVQTEVSIPLIYQMGCDNWYHSDSIDVCVFQQSETVAGTILLVGDSIGLQWFPAFHSFVKKNDWKLAVITKSACPMVDKDFYYARIGRSYLECSRWREQLLGILPEFHADLIVVGSSGSYGFSHTDWRDGSRRVLERVAAATSQVVVLAPTPVLPFNGPECENPRSALHAWLAQPTRCSHDLRENPTPSVLEALQEAAEGIPNVQVVDLTDKVCPHGVCQARVNGILAYRDHQHLNAVFAESLEEFLVERIKVGEPSGSDD